MTTNFTVNDLRIIAINKQQHGNIRQVSPRVVAKIVYVKLKSGINATRKYISFFELMN